MSGAMVGIVVACLAMLFLLLVALIIFLVCRRRLLAAKPPQSRRATADVRAMQESGCGPVSYTHLTLPTIYSV